MRMNAEYWDGVERENAAARKRWVLAWMDWYVDRNRIMLRWGKRWRENKVLDP